MGNSRRLIRAIDPQSVKKALASIARRKEVGPLMAAFEASNDDKGGKRNTRVMEIRSDRNSVYVP